MVDKDCRLYAMNPLLPTQMGLPQVKHSKRCGTVIPSPDNSKIGVPFEIVTFRLDHYFHDKMGFVYWYHEINREIETKWIPNPEHVKDQQVGDRDLLRRTGVVYPSSRVVAPTNDRGQR